MAYKYKTAHAHGSNYYSSSKRAKSTIKFIVFHYTGNDGDTDEANAQYFQSPNRHASAHYFIDDDSVTCSVEDEYSAWSVGGGLQDQGSPYKSKGAKYHNVCTNTNSISIEMCDTKKDKKNDLSAKTRANAIAFGAKKMYELGIDIDHAIRHFDVTGKVCPIYFITNEADWKKFKGELSDALNALKKEKAPEKNTTPEKKTIPALAKATLKKGNEGTQVKYLQKDLNYTIKSGLTVDGSFGPATVTAVKAFQKKYKLTVDGIYGPKSQAKMKTLLK